jgi:predicted nucleic acid-binding protein
MIRFADTSFFLALISPRDSAHRRAQELSTGSRAIVTTDAVLVELGNALSGTRDRRHFPGLFARVMDPATARDSRTTVVRTESLLQRAVSLYANRLDKQWSMTDCLSFVVMQDRGIREALTGDHHFEQAGFVALLK